jgi:7-keto-8-aminopelargonate synthetase-like enzyme
MIFSGPVQPPMLAAGVASARIHLSDEIDFLQEELASRIALFNRLSRDAGLPIVSRTNTPVRFVGVGDAAPTYDVAARLRQRGFFINISIFPAVPTRHSGIRLVLNRHHR